MTKTTMLQTIFNEIQICTPREYNERIAAALKIITADSSFIAILHAILSCKKAAFPARISNFLQRIFEELKEVNHEILYDIFCYLLGFIKSKNVRCRQHALRIVFLILHIEKYDLTIEMLQCISEKLFDREMCVRKEAVKICLMYQDHNLGDKLKLQGVLKDLIRFDQSYEIRRFGILQIVVSKDTINCIIERCVDASVYVRKSFWMGCFTRIKLEDISAPQKIFLMKSAFLEREFDAKSIFIRIIDKLGIESFADSFYCNEKVFDDIIENYLKTTCEEYTLNKYTPSCVRLMNIFYKVKEERDGRDSLNLADLEEFLDGLYRRCVELEEIIKKATSEALEKNVYAVGNQATLDGAKVVVGLFKMLSFYDLFSDSSRKLVLKIISHLLTKCSVKEVVEESVILCKRICSKDLCSFLGSIIKKIRGTPLCFVVAECVMKHLPYSELHEAIFQEIAIVNLNESIEIIYWYFYLKPSSNLQELFFSFLPNKRVVEGATDLVLTGLVDPSALEPCLIQQMSCFDENAVIPISKLLIAGKISGNDYFKFLMLIFYSTYTDSIQQYLSVYFHNYFLADSTPVIEVFCDVMQLITENYRIFSDQALYWITNSRTMHGSQRLFYTICLFICTNYDDLKNRKLLFAMLNRIIILPCWEPVLTKRIIYLVTQIIRRRPSENVQALITKLMEIDDGSPLSSEEFSSLKDLLKAS